MIRITGMISASGKIGVHAFGRSMHIRLGHEFRMCYSVVYLLYVRVSTIDGIHDAVLLTRARTGQHAC